ncbi:MAG: hypothetical protein WCF03_16455 [Nitrososphaeraceae archaeon]
MPTSQKRRTIHHSESAQWVKAHSVCGNDELLPYREIGSSSSREPWSSQLVWW